MQTKQSDTLKHTHAHTSMPNSHAHSVHKRSVVLRYCSICRRWIVSPCACGTTWRCVSTLTQGAAEASGMWWHEGRQCPGQRPQQWPAGQWDWSNEACCPWQGTDWSLVRRWVAWKSPVWTGQVVVWPSRPLAPFGRCSREHKPSWLCRCQHPWNRRTHSMQHAQTHT